MTSKYDQYKNCEIWKIAFIRKKFYSRTCGSTLLERDPNLVILIPDLTFSITFSFTGSWHRTLTLLLLLELDWVADIWLMELVWVSCLTSGSRMTGWWSWGAAGTASTTGLEAAAIIWFWIGSSKRTSSVVFLAVVSFL